MIDSFSGGNMSTISRRRFLQTLAVGSAAAASFSCSERNKNKRPLNLLFILTDQQPVSTLGCYGNPLNPTPHLDHLAETGTRFTDFYIGAFPCSPSRASILTGCYPQRHGVTTNNVILSDEVPSLGFLLRDAGRATAYFGKSHLSGHMYRNVPERKPYDGRWFYRRVPNETGFVYEMIEGGVGEDQPILGFDTWAGGWRQYHEYLERVGLGELLARRPKPGNHNDLPSGPNTEHRYSLLPAEHHMASFFTQKAEKFIRSRRGSTQPFSLFLSYYGPHLPVAPPKPWDTKYSIEQCPLPSNFFDLLEGKPEHQRINKVCYKLPNWSKDQFQDYIRRYYGYCAYLDAQIGQVLYALSETGLDQNTIVIFTSDHGDMLAAHGMVYKMNRSGYQELANVPFIIRIPGVTRPGSVVRSLSSSVDIFPTLIEMFGLPHIEGLQGKSFSKVLKWPESSFRERIFVHWANDSFVTFDGRWKYALHWNENVDELYDLENDPGELLNLWKDPRYKENVRQSRQAIIDWLYETDHPYAALIEKDKRGERI